MEPKKEVVKHETITIAPPNFETREFTIVGTAPYVQHKFSEKARKAIMEKQAQGSQGKKGAKREARDFDKEYVACIHFAEEGWAGIPAGAFRNALVSACRTVGFKMTLAKLSVFVEADGIDRDDGTPLVRIYGDYEKHEGAVRLETGVISIAVRPIWKKWYSKPKVRFDGDQFSATDVANLLMRVGMQVGLGEGRPDSKNSTGVGWGTFRLANDEDMKEIVKGGGK